MTSDGSSILSFVLFRKEIKKEEVRKDILKKIYRRIDNRR